MVIVAVTFNELETLKVKKKFKKKAGKSWERFKQIRTCSYDKINLV